jgi:hypothetical protein
MLRFMAGKGGRPGDQGSEMAGQGRDNALDHVVVVVFENRFKLGEEITAPYNAPEPGQAPTMDGYVTDYISTLTAELGRQPTYQEYSQVMTGFTPEQIPVLSELARGFGVFDHWFCEVPSQTIPPAAPGRSVTGRRDPTPR